MGTHRTTSRTRVAALAATAFVLAGLGAAGCGGNDEATDEGPVPTVTTTSETETTETGATETETTQTGATETDENEEADLTAGREVFTENCATCHTLADADATGTVGPNLDEAAPDRALVETRARNGKGVMPAFKGLLSDEQIEDVASYVSSVAGQ